MSKFFLNLEKPDRGGHQWKSTEKLKSSLKKLSLWSVFVFGFLFFSLFQNSNLLFAQATQVALKQSIDDLKYDLYSETEGGTTKYTATVASNQQVPSSTTAWNVVIPDKVSYNNTDYTVTKIGGNAFLDCDKLTSVTFPASLESIGDYAFYGCSKLTIVDLSECEKLTSIGTQAFRKCSGLKSVTFPASLESIGTYAFYDCSGLTSVTFPARLTSIGENTFYNCSGLKSVTFPASLTSIGSQAFNKCSGLTIVDLSGCTSLKSIVGSAFKGCSKLKSVTFPASLTSIGTSAFESCSVLESVDLSDCTSLTSIGNYAFEFCSGLKSVTFPASLTSIGTSAFLSCSKLTIVDLSECEKLTSIGTQTFRQCSELKSVTFPASLKSIGSQAFLSCSVLTSVNLSDCTSLESIDYGAFWSCSSLTSVDLSGCTSLKSIGEKAFCSCTNACLIFSTNFDGTINTAAFVNVKRVTILDDDNTTISGHFTSDTNYKKYKKVTFTYFDGNNPTVVMVQYVKSNTSGNSIKNPSEYNDQFVKSYSSYWRLPNSSKQFVFGGDNSTATGTTPVNDDLELIDAPAVVFSAGGGTFVFGSDDTLSGYEFLSDGNKTFLTYAYRTESGDNAPAYLINKVPGDALVYKGYEYSGWNLGETVYSEYNDVCNAFSAAYKSSPVTFTAAFEAIKYTIEYYSKQDDSYKLIKTETVTVEHSANVNLSDLPGLSGLLHWCVLDSKNGLVDTITIDANSTISYDDLAENGTYSTYLVSGQNEGQPPILKLGAVVQEYETAEIPFTKEFAGDYGKFVNAVESALDSKGNDEKQTLMKNLFSQLFSVSVNDIDLTQSTNLTQSTDLSKKLYEDGLNYYDITYYSINLPSQGNLKDSSIVFTIQVVKKVESERTITIKEKDDVFSGVYDPTQASVEVTVNS